MRRLLVAHLFKLADVLGLLLAHLLQSANALVGGGELLAEHRVVLLHALRHCALALHLHVHGTQMLILHLDLREATSFVGL